MQQYCPNCFAAIAEKTETCPSCRAAVLFWGRNMSETERLVHLLGHPARPERLNAIAALATLPQTASALPLADVCFSQPDDIWQALEVIRALSILPKSEPVETALARLALEHPAGPVQSLATYVLDTRFDGTGN